MRTPTDRGTPRRVPLLLGLFGAVLAGVVVAVQSRINGTLGTRTGDAISAGLVSFGGGLLILLVCCGFLRSARDGLRTVVREVRSGARLRPWQLGAGLCGAYLTFGQGLTATLLGVALFTVALVAGQVAAGLVVDRVGLGPAGPQSITTPRLIGGGVAIVAVLIAVSASLGTGQASWLILVPALAGVGIAVQSALNGRIKLVSGSTVSATTVNFLVGTTGLLLAFLVRGAITGFPDSFPPEPWLYIGGALGAVFIGGSAFLVHHTGVLLLSMGMIAGQLLGALFLDLVVPAPGTQVHLSTVVGIALTLLAVAIAALPAQPVRRAEASQG